MKKVVVSLLVLSMLSVFSPATFAMESSEVQMDTFMQVEYEKIRNHYEKLGYTEVQLPSSIGEICIRADVDSYCRSLALTNIVDASPELKQEILKAREEIIYAADGWYADDKDLYVVWFDSTSREWGELPRFSDLFPGWDLPSDVANMGINELGVPTDWSSSDIVQLKMASATEMVDPYRTWTLHGEMYEFSMEIKELTTSKHCNLGITDMSVTPHESIIHKKGMGVGEGFEGACWGSRVLGLRASTDSVPGTARIFSRCGVVD